VYDRFDGGIKFRHYNISLYLWEQELPETKDFHLTMYMHIFSLNIFSFKSVKKAGIVHLLNLSCNKFA
jgi:hypothetical protein